MKTNGANEIKVAAKRLRERFQALQAQHSGTVPVPKPWGWTLGALADEIARGLDALVQTGARIESETEARVDDLEEKNSELEETLDAIRCSIRQMVDDLGVKPRDGDIKDADPIDLLDAIATKADHALHARENAADRIRDLALEQEIKLPSGELLLSELIEELRAALASRDNTVAPVPDAGATIAKLEAALRDAERTGAEHADATVQAETRAAELRAELERVTARLADALTSPPATISVPAAAPVSAPKKQKRGSKLATTVSTPSEPLAPGALEVDRKALVEILRLASKVSSGKNTIPVTHNLVLSSPRQGALEIRATDIDTHLSVELPAAGALLNPILVSTQELLTAAAGAKTSVLCLTPFLPSPAEVPASSAPARGKLRAGDMVLGLGDAGEFPAWPETGATAPKTGAPVQFTLSDGAAFQRALEHVLLAESTDRSRAGLCGTYFDAGKLIAADGHRMHIALLPGSAVLGPASVPRLDLLVTMLHRLGPGSVEVAYHQADPVNRARFRYSGQPGECKVFARVDLLISLNENQFPDWRQIVPTSGSSSVIVSGRLLADALKGAVNVRAGQVKLLFSDDRIAVKTEDVDSGTEYKKDVPCTGKVSPDLRVSYNPRYLLDALHYALGSGDDFSVTLQPRREGSPTMLMINDLTGLVMPMRD